MQISLSDEFEVTHDTQPELLPRSAYQPLICCMRNVEVVFSAVIVRTSEPKFPVNNRNFSMEWNEAI
jgi:hypothetical protein